MIAPRLSEMGEGRSGYKERGKQCRSGKMGEAIGYRSGGGEGEK